MAQALVTLDRILNLVHGSEYFFGLKSAIRVEEKLLVHQSGLRGLRKPSHEPFTLGYGHGTLSSVAFFNAYCRVQFVFLASNLVARQCGTLLRLIVVNRVNQH